MRALRLNSEAPGGTAPAVSGVLGRRGVSALDEVMEKFG